MPTPSPGDAAAAERGAPLAVVVAPPDGSLRPTLADWIDLVALTSHDEGLPDAALRHRDRAIGTALGHRARRPAERLVGWVRCLRQLELRGALPGGARAPTPGPRTAEAVRLAALGLAALSLALGASAALGAFSFQPQGRINAVAVLGVLVGVPWIFLLFALLDALPARARRWLPVLGSEPEGGGLLQPARWLLRVLPPRVRASLADALGRGAAFERGTAPLRRWGLLSVSQGAAVAFNVGALAAALGLVVFSDLAFGWSTTLDVDVADAHRIARALAAPWAALWPAAVPSAELLEVTRYFRIAGEPDPAIPPEVYGGWWRFVVMALVSYGLLPRLAFLALARARFRVHLVRAMRELPASRRVLDRLDSPLVESAGPQPDETALGAATPARARRGEGADTRAGAVADTRPGAASGASAMPARAVVVSWSEALAEAPELLHGTRAVARFDAGGRRTPDDDAATAREAAGAARREDAPLLVVVRGFEPPLLECLDFLRDLRRALGEGHELVVTPVGGGRGEREAWRRSLAAHGDPWLVWSPAAPPRSEETRRA